MFRSVTKHSKPSRNATPGKDRQRAYRQRVAQRYLAMEKALETIVAKLADNQKPLAVELREIAQAGLEGSA